MGQPTSVLPGRFRSFVGRMPGWPYFRGTSGRPYGWWVSPWHYGLNQGPIVLMIENHRTGLLWKLMRKCPYIAGGLRRADFTGGWL